MQGLVDPLSGLPSSLNGRLKSGTAVDRSHANVVLRHLRISGQAAPVDVNVVGRAGLFVGATAGYGGAFEYDGGSSDPSDLVRIIFIELIFDHNVATSCATHPLFFKKSLPTTEFVHVAEEVAPSA